MNYSNSTFNSQPLGRGKAFFRKLFRSNSQQACDPAVVQAALDKAQRENPQIYKPREPTKDNCHHYHIYDAGVSYPAEYEGNEPMDYSCGQQPLEPTVAPHILGMDMDQSSATNHINNKRRPSPATVDHTRRRTSGLSKQSSVRSAKLRNSNPQKTLRQLEEMANVNSEGALNRLHALKMMPPSA